MNTVQDTAAYYFDLYIPESQIEQFHADQKVNVHFPYLD
ncbi:hypothetical protein J2T16_000611 [Paenibacillus intestini]|nr:hypothetical protein [Paenibacillus intestini]